jgi:Protein of unknown function (DUF1778)
MNIVAFEFRMTPEQRESLRAAARAQGITMQEFLELAVFKEVRPRQKVRRKPRYPQAEELPLAG